MTLNYSTEERDFANYVPEPEPNVLENELRKHQYKQKTK